MEAVVLLALISNLVTGLAVFWMNPRRRANRYFAYNAVALAFWLGSILLGLVRRDELQVLFWIRQASLAAALLIPCFDLLRHAIVHVEESRRTALRDARVWILLTLPTAVLCQLPGFVQGVRFAAHDVPQPVYGPLQPLYIAYWLVALAILVARFRRSFRDAAPDQRYELEFTVIGFVVAGLTGIGLGQLIPFLTGRDTAAQFTPLAVVLFNAIVAYGVATHRIMHVTDLLRRGIAYGLLFGYLCGVYALVTGATGAALRPFWEEAVPFAHLVGALVVAFSMTPARGMLQRVVNRLFINMQGMDVQGAIRGASEVLRSIGPLDTLMNRFSDVLRSAAGTDRILILRRTAGGVLRQAYPPAVNGSVAQWAADDPLCAYLVHVEPLADAVALRRKRRRPEVQAVLTRMRELQVELVAAIRVKGELAGALLLGRRLSGRVYGVSEQEGILLLCDQLGVAIENATLYTEVQNSSIYNDILLNSLTSGIVAVNTDHRITVCNAEASRMIGISPAEAVGEPLDILPAPLAAAARAALDTGEGLRDRDEDLLRPGASSERMPVRVSSSRFHAHTGEPLGVLVVLNDMTMLKQLEEHVRRSDRLASLGTLSAGMAHEIKNPLVSIRTFTELLPEKYDDPEFRTTFTSLLGQEVRRIDDIVNRLLTFARPAPARLEPMHLHTAVEQCLQLMRQEIDRHQVALHTRLNCRADRIRGDAGQLRQALLNFILNALEAMPQGGRLDIGLTESFIGWRRGGGPRGAVRLTIRDTGIGIPPEKIARIFDPFYTTKRHGTGLGLSVSHGILQEHNASIDVESLPGDGTALHILFPLLEEDARVETTA